MKKMMELPLTNFINTYAYSNSDVIDLKRKLKIHEHLVVDILPYVFLFSIQHRENHMVQMVYVHLNKTIVYYQSIINK